MVIEKPNLNAGQNGLLSQPMYNPTKIRQSKGSFIGDYGNGPLPFYLEAPSVAGQNKAHLQIREILFSKYLKQSQKNKANNAVLLLCHQCFIRFK